LSVEAKQVPTAGVAKFGRGATIDLGGNFQKIDFEVWLNIPQGAAEISDRLRDYLKTGQDLLDGMIEDWGKAQKTRMPAPVEQSSPLQPATVESTKPWKKWKSSAGESLREDFDPEFAKFLDQGKYDGKTRFHSDDGFDYWLPPLGELYTHRYIMRIRRG